MEKGTLRLEGLEKRVLLSTLFQEPSQALDFLQRDHDNKGETRQGDIELFTDFHHFFYLDDGEKDTDLIGTNGQIAVNGKAVAFPNPLEKIPTYSVTTDQITIFPPKENGSVSSLQTTGSETTVVSNFGKLLETGDGVTESLSFNGGHYNILAIRGGLEDVTIKPNHELGRVILDGGDVKRLHLEIIGRMKELHIQGNLSNSKIWTNSIGKLSVSDTLETTNIHTNRLGRAYIDLFDGEIEANRLLRPLNKGPAIGLFYAKNSTGDINAKRINRLVIEETLSSDITSNRIGNLITSSIIDTTINSSIGRLKVYKDIESSEFSTSRKIGYFEVGGNIEDSIVVGLNGIRKVHINGNLSNSVLTTADALNPQKIKPIIYMDIRGNVDTSNIEGALKKVTIGGDFFHNLKSYSTESYISTTRSFKLSINDNRINTDTNNLPFEYNPHALIQKLSFN